ncbi:MAG: glycosyltransferase family A protein [Schleiferiaceae bacterium]
MFYPQRPLKPLRPLVPYVGNGINSIPEEELAKAKAYFEEINSHPEPMISVSLIAWNEEENLPATLMSLSLQKCKFPFEVLVVNNNSTDDTSGIINAFGIKEVLETKQGYPFARQAGLDAARGKVIVSGDADTLYAEGWVEELAKPLLNDTSVTCTYGRHRALEKDGKYGWQLWIYQWLKGVSIWMKHPKRPHLNSGGASMAFRKEDTFSFDGFVKEKVRGSDGIMAFNLGKKGKIKMITPARSLIWTSMRRTEADGSLLSAAWIRIKSQMRYFFHYFSKQKEH